MGKLAICLFGSLQVKIDGVPVRTFESDKTRALLAYLAMEAGQAHRREKLAGLLWPEHSEALARHSLSQALYSLRGALQESVSGALQFLLITPQVIQLNPAGGCWSDVGEFNRLLDACKEHPHSRLESCPACQEHLQQAVALYQGDFMEGFSLPGCAAYEEWILVTRQRCQQSARQALAALATCHERQGHLQEALQNARRLAEMDPLDDGACRQLLRLLAASGQRAAALAHYQGFRSFLQAELGLSPQAETSALYRRILQEKGSQLALPVRRHNLPASLSPLIGRQAELAELQKHLLDPACRLVTILGPGGSGKSRLALEAARGLLERFADGVYLVSLSPLTSPEAIPPALATALDFKITPQNPPLEQLQDYLRQKELLLVLDGCEGLLKGVPLFLDLMRAASELKILATSRARLKLEEEQVYLLGGLECPDSKHQDAASFPAIRLFASGARRIQPRFELDPQNLPAVVEICTQVQGMPLAILLAVAWVEVFSPQEILAEIHQSPDFLQAEWADLPIRQRSVRATFDYSWNLLDENEQGIFQALCVFRGKFTRQAAEVVSGVDPIELRRLVEKSLVMPLTGEWYAIHTLLQQFGLEKLNTQPTASREVHQRYSAYFLENLLRWEAGIKCAHQLETLALLDTKIDDLRPAWDWAVEHREFHLLESGVEGLCLYYELRARFIEGKNLCLETARQLAEPGDPEARRLLAHLSVWESRYYRLLGERELARQQLERSQALVDELVPTGLDARSILAFAALEAGEAVFSADLKAAHGFLERSLGLYRQLRDAWRTAGVLYRLGVNRGHAGDYAASELLSNEAIQLYQGLGASSGVAAAQRTLAQNQVRLGKLESALALMRQVINFYQASGDQAQASLDMRTLALLQVWNGLFDDVPYQLQQALSLAQELGNLYEIAFIQLLLGSCYFLIGEYASARGSLEASLELARSHGFQREAAFSLWAQGCIALVEESTQQAQPLFHESISLYRQVGHLDELAWALSMEALCLLDLGATSHARLRLMEALEIACSLRAYQSALFALVVGAHWVGSLVQAETALELFDMAAQQPVFAHSAWFHQLFEKSILACTSGLPSELAAAARERGRQRSLWSCVDELYQLLSTGSN